VQRQSLIRPCSRDTHPAQISADDVAGKINGSADRFDCYHCALICAGDVTMISGLP
jgi:hypothetical protein